MEFPKLLVFKDKKSYFIDIFGKRYELILPIEEKSEAKTKVGAEEREKQVQYFKHKK